jgi:hypothetical protein
MASVYLDFVPPDRPGIVSLKIWEAAVKTGPYTVIETVAAGTYPNYITRHSTDDAASANNWFKISWVDDAGVESPISEAIQGGTTTLVGEIVARVMLRDPSIDENVAYQESLAAIEEYFKADPTTVALADASYAVRSGLTLLTMARSYIFSSVTESTSDDYTAGLVQQKGGTSKTKIDLDSLIAWANRFLGTNFSTIMLMEEIEIAGGLAGEVTMDQTRLIVEFP